MLTVEHLAWTLPDGNPILSDISLTAKDGKLVVVTGPNGSGKTSLAKLIAGLRTPTSGRILFNGQDISAFERNEGMGLVIGNLALWLSVISTIRQ